MERPYQIIVALADHDLTQRLFWKHALRVMPEMIAMLVPEYQFLTNPAILELSFKDTTTAGDAIHIANEEPHLLVIDYDLEEPAGGLVVIEYIHHQELPISIICHSSAPLDTPRTATLQQLVSAEYLIRPFHSQRVIQLLAFTALRPIFDAISR